MGTPVNNEKPRGRALLASERFRRAEADLLAAEADRATVRELLRRATDARDAERSRGADPVLLCHHAELLSLLIRRLAEIELRVVRIRIRAGRCRARVAAGGA